MTDWLFNQIDEINDNYRRWQQMKPDSNSWRPKGERQIKECRYCGESGFHWLEVDGKWKLVDSMDEVHVCDDYVPPATKDPVQDEVHFLIDAKAVGFSEHQAQFLWLKFGKS